MHVYLFDIDGTLVSTGGAGKAAMERALTTAFGVPGHSNGVAYSGRTDRSIAGDLFRLHGVADSPENWQRLQDAYLRHLPDTLAEFQGRVLPGVVALLEQLAKRADVALGLLTGNVREGARLKLGHFGLFHHFSFGGFGDYHLDRDDVAREALAAVCQQFGSAVPRERIWVVGDTPLDVRCARCIGVRVAAVATGWHPLEELAATEPDLLFTDLSDPKPLLKIGA